MKIIRVTQTVDYAIDDHVTDLEGLLREWFEDSRFPLDSSHAYRDGSRIGFSARVVSYKEVPIEQVKKELEERKARLNETPS